METLLDMLFNDQVSLENCVDWILGKEKQDTDLSVQFDKTEFVLNLLKYIQEASNKFLANAPSSTSQAKVKDLIKSQAKEDPKKNPVIELQKKSHITENDTKKREPFQVINEISPLKCLNQGNEVKKELFTQERRSVLTSTLIHSHRNNSDHEHFPVLSRKSNGSSFSDESVSYTPHSETQSNSSSGSISFSTPNHTPTTPISPTSPSYPNRFPDISYRSRSRTPLTPSLGDFIVTKSNSSKKSRKRIKPTQLTTTLDKDVCQDSHTSNNAFGAISRPFISVPLPLKSSPEQNDTTNFEEERNLLKQKRISGLKISAENPSKTITILTTPNSQNEIKTKCSKEQSFFKENQFQCSVESSNNFFTTNPVSLVDPDPSLIEYMDRVVKLATVYSACLDANLVPNIMAELYLVFMLLASSYKSKTQEGSKRSSQSLAKNIEPSPENQQCNILMQNLSLDGCIGNSLCQEVPEKVINKDYLNVLCSVHNCVMFAAVVIEKQITLIQTLDKSVTRLLLDNIRLPLFVPHFIPQLIQKAETKETVQTKCLRFQKPLIVRNAPVLYQTETDSKDNFSSDLNFQSFKKQRDTFYEILHEWKTNNEDIFWATKKFPFKVQTLLGLSSDPVNMMHMARLFCAQLISSNLEHREEEIELTGVSKDKLSRLQARFNKPQVSPRPPPHFPGEQQFYQQFLHLAFGFPFLIHVADCLAHRINILNGTDFSTDGLDFEERKSHIQTCVSNCCLMAKFLGLIVFSPYQSVSSLLPETMQAQIIVRQQVLPYIDLLAYLQKAMETNRLVVTVPWAVSFLGMMDPVAPYLPSYRPVLQLLVSVYRSLPLPHISPLSSMLLRFSLGWLFDKSFFPETLFFLLFSKTSQLPVWKPEPADVDVKDVVDQTLLSELFPFLGYLRHLLLSSTANVKQGSARHITPVSAYLTPTTQTTFVQALELQLEESFLNCQSASFRSTVDFVTERIASSCIKHICSNVVASRKEQFSNKVSTSKEELKKMSKKQVQQLLVEVCKDTEEQIETDIIEHCGTKMETACNILLGPDASDPAVNRTILDICMRRCREKIVFWLSSHINLSDMFSKLIPLGESKPSINNTGSKVGLDYEDTKTAASELHHSAVKSSNTLEHRDTSTSPSDLLIELQDRLCLCFEHRDSVVSEENITDLINTTLETVQHRMDLIGAAEHTIYTATADLCIMLLAYTPFLVTPQVLERLCSLWSCAQSKELLSQLMSARNVMLLCQGGATHAQFSWNQLSIVLVEVLKAGLLTPKQLEAQFIALYRLSWPPMVLTLLGSCLTLMLEKIKKDPLCSKNSKFVLMLEWVNEMTEELVRDNIFVNSM